MHSGFTPGISLAAMREEAPPRSFTLSFVPLRTKSNSFTEIDSQSGHKESTIAFYFSRSPFSNPPILPQIQCILPGK
jgi:hypothetical protein